MSKELVDQVVENGIHRFLSEGVHYRDLRQIQAAARAWPDWCGVWCGFAAEAEARGDAARAAGHALTAGEEWTRAALYYHFAQYLFFIDPAAKRTAQARKVAAFERARPLLDPPLERVEIPFESVRLPGYLRRPGAGAGHPCVVIVGGLDTTKEDALTFCDLCTRRGLATLAFDGPGQGETFDTMRWRRDFERAVMASIDYLETRRDVVDPTRIGVVGRSLGAHYAVKAAASDPRIRAAVAWGLVNRPNLHALPPARRLTRDGFLFVSGTRTVDEAAEFFAAVDLERLPSPIGCPLLVVHGGRDPLAAPADAARLAEKATTGSVLFWEDSVHCCHDRAHIVRPAMADFVAAHLAR